MKLFAQPLVFAAAMIFAFSAQNNFGQGTVYWRNTAANGNWANDDGSNINNWYRSTPNGWDVRRGDLGDGQWSATGTKAYNIFIFDNGTQATTTVNAIGGAQHLVYRLLLRNNTDRTFNATDGGNIKLGGGSEDAKIETEAGATGTYTFNVPIELAKTTEISAVNGNMVFNSGSTINTAGNILESHTASGKRVEFKGVISGTSGQFQHKGAGLVILEAANTYSGATTVEAAGGVVQIKNASALGSGSSTTVSSGAALETYGNLGTVSEALTINGTGVSSGGSLRNVSGSSTWSGAITLGSASRINSDTGTLTLDVASGNAITGAQNLTFGGAGDITVNDPIATSSGTLTKDGAGRLTLTGANTFTGAVTISAGALRAANSTALGAVGGGVTVSAQGAALELSGGISVGAEALSLNSDGVSNGGALRNVSGSNTWGGDVTIAGADTRINSDTSSTLTLGGALNINSNTVYLGGAGDITLGGAIQNGGKTASNGALWWDGSGTLRINATPTALAGNISLRRGTVLLGATSALGTGAITIGADGTTTLASADGTARSIVNNITLSNDLNLGQTSGGTGVLTLNGTLGLGSATRTVTVNAASEIVGAVSSGSLTKAGSAQLTLSSDSSSFSTLTVNAGTVAINGNTTITGLAGSGTGAVSIASAKVLTVNNSIDQTFSQAISGSGGLTKSGTANLTLGTANTFGGNIIISGGTLTVGADDRLGSTTGSAVANRLQLGGGTLAVSSGFTLNSNRGITLNTGGGTIDVASGQTLTYGGVMAGANAFTKAGAGILTLGGSNSFSGQLVISAGTLSITNGNSLGSGSLGLGNAGTTATLLVNSNTTIANRLEIADSSSSGVINVASETTTTISGILSQTNGTSQATKIGKEGEGTLIMNNGSGTYNGQIQVGRGTLVVGATGALGANTSTANRGIDLGLNVGDVSTANNVSVLASNNVTVAQSFYVAPNTSGAKRTVGLAGSGTNTFSNEFFLHGNLTVDAGTTSSDRVNLTGKITSTGGLIKTGSGTAVLSGTTANDYSGNTTINQGTLQLQKTGVEAISSGTIAVNGGTLLLGAASQIGNGVAIDMSGGTVLDTGGFSDQVGQLRFTGTGVTATIKGLAAGDNGSFIFSDLETASIGRLATSAGGVGGLTFSGSGYDFTNGFKIKLFSTDISSTLTSNNFSTKISFEGASQVGAISFTGGSSTYLNVAAIPEPKVYVAAGALALLIGLAEFRRRKKIVSSKV